MEKQEEKDALTPETQVQEEERKPTNRERFNTMMKERIEGFDPEDEEGSYRKLIDSYNSQEEQKKILSDAINRDPRLAQVLSDIVSNKRSAGNALVRYYGRDFLSAEEGTPEYQDIMAAEEERRKEAEQLTSNQKMYNDNLQESTPVIEAFCKEKGYETDEFMDRIWEKIAYPILSGVYTRELLDMFDKSFNYDTDVNDALAAGEVKGRNMNINKMRNDRKGDGLPTGMGTQPPKSTQKPKNKSFIELAGEA